MLLEAALNQLQTRRPDLHLVHVRLAPLFEYAMVRLEPAVPALIGLRYPQAAVCLFTNPALCPDVPSELFNSNLGYVFWDIVHPTTEAHRMLGDYLYEQLENSYTE
jgi:phospholipase/lecithinase/hemolysin